LTDSKKLKPTFIKEIRGELSEAEGKYGVFGTFKVVKFFRRLHSFLTADGICFIRPYTEVEKKNKNCFTPIDPKWFGGEKIVHVNHHVYNAYVT
jgi:hypothetical protein